MIPEKLKIKSEIGADSVRVYGDDKDHLFAMSDQVLRAEIVRRYNAFDDLLAACKNLIMFNYPDAPYAKDGESHAAGQSLSVLDNKIYQEALAAIARSGGKMKKLTSILFLALFTLPVTGAERKDMNELIEQLIPALIQVESGGDSNAIGDNGEAIGILQIHKCVVDDVNKLFGFRHFNYADRYVAEKAKQLCVGYLILYGDRYRFKADKQPTLEVLARIWNGGPNGWKKKSTEKYWLKVQKELAKGRQK